MTEKLWCGIGAQCSVQVKFLHPSKVVKDKIKNPTAQTRVSGLIALHKEKRSVNKREQAVIVFRHADFEDTELYSVARWVKVTKEGHASQLFLTDKDEGGSGDPVVNADDACAAEMTDEMFHTSGNRAEDIARMRALGFDVDDDNDCLPENVPSSLVFEESTTTGPINEQTWGWDGMDNRKQVNATDVRATINNMSSHALSTVSYLQMFFLFYPKWLIEDVIIPQTNKGLEEPLSLGEFIRWIGVWLFLATISGFKRADFWSMNPVDRLVGAPYRVNDIMSGRRFNAILKAISYTNEEPPHFQDKFWEVRQMLKVWNDHMKENFVPSWISCLDESISIWHNRWTCPGWIYCPRKPHPYGSEYHTICCCMSGILFGLEILEGKDHPSQIPADPKTKKTSGLLLRLFWSLYSSGKVVVLDSGFCVLQALINLRKVGVFAGALIKKRRYWPKYVPGDAIDQYFEDKDVGDTDSLAGVLDGVKYDLFCMKEPEYVMKVMATYSGLTVKDGERESKRIYSHPITGKTKTSVFRYAEPFSIMGVIRQWLNYCVKNICVYDRMVLQFLMAITSGSFKGKKALVGDIIVQYKVYNPAFIHEQTPLVKAVGNSVQKAVDCGMLEVSKVGGARKFEPVWDLFASIE